MQHIIVGVGPAGVTACETIRRMDPNAEITLLTGQNEPPYSRMAIPYLLEEKIDESGTYLRHDKYHFGELKVKILYDKVSKIIPENNLLELESGGQLNYDKLLLATGANPISPPIPGIDLAAVNNCWTLDDARLIADKATPGASVILMGAGFIGCIILESLVTRGVNLTVVEMGNRMVPRMMDDTAGGLLKAWCESKGVTILTGHQVTSINEVENSLRVEIKDHQVLTADLVICATGVKSNIDFIEGSNIAVDQGIKVDQYFQTNIENIYAAGDVAQGLDFSDNSWHVQAIQPTAVEHGRIAGMNMVKSQSCEHRGSINMNILDTLGLISTSFGQWMGVTGGEQSILLDEQRYRYLNLQFQDDYLVGLTSLGHTENIGVVRGLIRGKVKLGIWKDRLIKDPSRLMEAYLATSIGLA